MPELPDVEGFRRVLAEHARGREVEAVEVIDRAMLRNRTPQGLGRALKGRRFREPVRHGKWLLAPIGEVVVLMHFRMTGLLEWVDDGERHRHDRIVFRCRGGELRYRNMRRFGGVWVAAGGDQAEAVTGPLGPDAAGLRRKDFHELLEHRRGAIKAALVDQRLIAGLGNLLVDEMLWVARIHPRSHVSSLEQERLDALFDALRKTLRDSIPTGRVPPRRGWLTGCATSATPAAHAAVRRCAGRPWPDARPAGARTASPSRASRPLGTPSCVQPGQAGRGAAASPRGGSGRSGGRDRGGPTRARRERSQCPRRSVFRSANSYRPATRVWQGHG